MFLWRTIFPAAEVKSPQVKVSTEVKPSQSLLVPRSGNYGMSYAAFLELSAEGRKQNQ